MPRYGAAKDGRIPAVRVGGPAGPVRFVKSDLLAHVAAARACWVPGETSASALRRAGTDP